MALGKRSRSGSFAFRKRRRTGPMRFNRFRKRRVLAPRRTGGFYSVRMRRLGAEKKTIDQQWLGSASASNTDPWLLNATATGSDFTQRIGRRIKMKSLLLRVYLSVDAAIAASTTNLCRVLVVLDKQWNATTTAGGAVSGAPPVATAYNITPVLTNIFINSATNLNNRDRYKILVDKFMTISQSGPAGGQISIYKKMNIDVTYGGTTFDGGSIQTNALLIYIISNQTAGTNDASFNATSRIRFVDM